MTRLFLILSLFFASQIVAQHQFDIWCFGNNAGLDFSHGKPVAFKSYINADEGCSSISDPQTGKLLFYTDGRTVFNADHDAMPGGYGLLADESSTQAALIMNMPGDANRFYIFTTSPDLNYSIVDMSKNNGLGDVVKKNTLMEEGVCEKLTAGMHVNGKDVWLIAHDSGNDRFLSFLITTQGVSDMPVESSGGTVDGKGYSIGQMQMNEQGTQLVMASYTPGLDIFNFNNTTGKLTFRYTLLQETYVYGAGFSPNGRFIYIMQQSGGYSIYQYDLNAGDKEAVISSKYQVAHSSDCYGAIQIGPDGRIYTPDRSRGSVSVINYPDKKGESCGFSQSAITLSPGTTSELGLPQAFWTKNTVLMPLPPPY